MKKAILPDMVREMLPDVFQERVDVLRMELVLWAHSEEGKNKEERTSHGRNWA